MDTVRYLSAVITMAPKGVANQSFCPLQKDIAFVIRTTVSDKETFENQIDLWRVFNPDIKITAYTHVDIHTDEVYTHDFDAD